MVVEPPAYGGRGLESAEALPHLRLEPLQLLDQRLDARSDFAPLSIPLALRSAKRLQLAHHGAEVLSLELTLRFVQALLCFQQPALRLFQLVLQPLPIVLEALNQSRSFFHPLGEQVEI